MEAAMMLTQTPPGMLRRKYGFFTAPFFSQVRDNHDQLICRKIGISSREKWLEILNLLQEQNLLR